MKEMGVSQGRPVLTPCLLFASPKTLGPMQVKHIHFVCSLKHLRGVIREKDDKSLRKVEGIFVSSCFVYLHCGFSVPSLGSFPSPTVTSVICFSVLRFPDLHLFSFHLNLL